MTLCLGPGSTTRVVAPSRFNHVKCPPSPALAPFVEHYWLTRWDRRGQPARTAAALLDPCFHLHMQDGRATVMGVARGTFTMRARGRRMRGGHEVLAWRFLPFAPQPASCFTDRTVDANELFAGCRRNERSLVSALGCGLRVRGRSGGARARDQHASRRIPRRAVAGA